MSAAEGTLTVYPPVATVIVPAGVPLTRMLTPGNGCWSSPEITFPVTVACANADDKARNTKQHVSNAPAAAFFSFPGRGCFINFWFLMLVKLVVRCCTSLAQR